MASDLILAETFDMGGRPVQEDRGAVRRLTTAGGLDLTLALVADGVGGEGKGERAAQLALDTFLDQAAQSTEKNVPRLLTRAVQIANQVVFAEVRTSGSKTMSTTLSAAAILTQDGTRTLYVAHVGDSRIYLLRNGKLSRLTVDHTFSTMMNFLGDLAPNFARPSQSEALVRAVGLRERVAVDIGFYVGVSDPDIATARGLKGLPLEPGDSVLVCSDGLVKRARTTGEPLVSPEEIIRALEIRQGARATQALVSLALSRNPEDNISVALVQIPGGAALRKQVQPRIGLYVLSIIVVAVLIALTALSLFMPPTAVSGARQQAVDIGRVTRPDGTESALTTYADIGAVESSLWLKGKTGASIVTLPGARVRFTETNSLTLLDRGALLLRAGDSAPLLLTPGSANLQLTVQSGCLGVKLLSESLVTASCYAGTCGYRLAPGATQTSIDPGKRLLLDLRAQTPAEVISIPADEKQAFRDAVSSLKAADDQRACGIDK